MRGGKLRHRVAIEAPPTGRDATGGMAGGTWTVVFASLPASIEPVSAREFGASNRIGSEVTTRIVIRWAPGVTADMRVRDLTTGDLYNIQGVLPDPKSNREYLTLPCTTGINDG